MATHTDAPAPQPQQPERPVNNRDRANRLYADARVLERISTNEQAKEIARNVALLALDLLAEARAERSA